MFVLKARDEAETTALVTSHRLGSVSSPSIIAPLIAAVEEKGINAQIYYCRSIKPFNKASEVQLLKDSEQDGATLNPIKSPRLHAKMLAWDDDILITSLNWLSADPIELNE